jgi:regulatory protein
MRTEAEMRRLLVSRCEPGPTGDAVIQSVIIRLREYGFLNDRTYAETYTRLRHENEKLGQRRVKENLKQKGIPEALIAETLDARYAGTNEEALARDHLARKRIKLPETPKEVARVMRRLVTAGFSTGTIYKILRQWDVPDEALAALDNLNEESHPPGDDS